MSGKKSFVLIACFCIFAVLAAVAAGCGAKKATEGAKISAIVPESGAPGSNVEIMGEKFGNTQGDGVVHIGGQVADVVAWSDIVITATVPAKLAEATQPVTVLTSQGESNELDFSVVAQGKQPDRKENQIEHVTAAQAMTDFEKKLGKDVTGMTFSIVKISDKDPTWKIDEASQQGKPAIFFLLHKENDNWVVKDDGTALTNAQLQADGAPSDLYETPPPPPKPAPVTQLDAVKAFLKSQGKDQTGVAVVVTRVSSTNPAWELGIASKAGQPDQVVVFQKQNGNWVVINMGTSFTYEDLLRMGVPDDLAHTNTEARAISQWIQAGNAPPGVTDVGWTLKVIKVSRIDDDWEIVQGNQAGQTGAMYFILHWEGTDWVVKDDGGTLTRQDLNPPGMPADLP